MSPRRCAATRRAAARRSTGCTPRCEPRREAWDDIVKIGRTHLQDATPLTLGQEFSGYAAQLDQLPGADRAGGRCTASAQLAQGGTAVGTGLNAPAGLRPRTSPRRSPTSPGCRSSTAPQQVRGARRRTTRWSIFSGALNTLAVALTKIANDIRLLGSGPRSGLGELTCRRTSRAARSCRARSTRPSARC